MDDDVRYLNAAPGTKHTVDLFHHGHLVRAEVDDAVADHDIDGLVVHGQVLGQAFPDFDVREPGFAGAGGGLSAHRFGHIDGDHAPTAPDLTGGDKAIESGAAADVEHSLALLQVAQRERIPGAGERLNGALRKRVHVSVRVAEHPRQRPARVKVEALFRVLRYFAVLFTYLRSQHLGIHRRRPHVHRHWYLLTRSRPS